MYKLKYLLLIILYSIINNSFSQWVKITDLPNNPFTDLFFIDDMTGFTLGHEFVYKTIDGGYTWDSTQLGGNLDILYEFDFINRDTGFIVGEVSGSRAFVTYDQGETWSGIEPYAFSTDISVINSNEFMWCVSGTPGLRRYNVILGLEQSLDPGIIVEDVEVFSEDTVFVGGGGFSKSFDGGTNWEITEMPGIIWMDFPSTRVGYSSADRYYKTTDFGATWTELMLPYYFDGCTSPEIVSDSIGYFPCGYDDDFDYHGIMKTMDGGESWIFTESDPPLFDDDAIGKIFCLNKDTCWCVTYTGQIYYTTNGGGETEAPVTVIGNLANEILISPNPATNLIKLQLPQNIQFETIYTYNIFGQITDITFDETGVAKIEDLMPGIYFTQLTTKTATIVKKWIKA